MEEKKSMGPFQALGRLFGMAGTLIETTDNVITRSAKMIDTGFDAIEIPMDNMLEDLKCDSIVDNAKRRVRIANANAEAEIIEAELKPKAKRGPKASTAK